MMRALLTRRLSPIHCVRSLKLRKVFPFLETRSHLHGNIISLNDVVSGRTRIRYGHPFVVFARRNDRRSSTTDCVGGLLNRFHGEEELLELESLPLVVA